MTPNDSEVDVLLRRFAKVASGVKTTEHLDADELNAFAEGVLPAAVRSRYVSHLADCDDCRRAVTELAIASGRVEKTTVPESQPAATESWWQKIGPLFAPARLRYAAFAAVLVAVVGIGFAVWRRSHDRPSADSVAQSNQTQSQDARTISQPQEPTNAVTQERSNAVAKTIPQPTPAPFVEHKQQPDTTAVSPAPPPKTADTVARNDALSAANAGRAIEPAANTAAPSYAPAPGNFETERNDTRNREQQNFGLIHGPQRAESNEKLKAADDRSRGAGDFAKARDEDRPRTGSDQPVAKEEESKNEGAARKRSESRPATLAGRPASGVRQEEPKSDKAAPPEEADTRTVGGRKFQRQGTAWIDVKLKPSMSIRTISRGSDEFEKLDAGLRSISQQFNGPIVVVWKGKAYRIQ